MSDLALLGTRFITEGADQTNRQLDQYAANANKAADASDKAAGGGRRLSASMQQMVDSVARTERELAQVARAERDMAQAADYAAASTRSLGLAANQSSPALSKAGRDAQVAASHFDRLHDSFQHDFAAQYVAQMGAVVRANDTFSARSKVLTQTNLNLSRQFADVGVQASMGTNALMIAIMQGPQIADAFAQAKSQGVGFKDALGGLAKSAVGLVATWGPLIAVAGAGASAFMLWKRHAEELKEAKERLATVSRRVAEGQNAVLTALSSAASFAEKYAATNASLNKAIDGVIASQNTSNSATMSGVGATVKATEAATRRAEVERILTVQLLEKAAAEAGVRAKALEDEAKAAQTAANRAGLWSTIGSAWSAAESPGGVDPIAIGDAARARQERELGVATTQRAAAAEREYEEALKAAADETRRMALVTPEAQKARSDAASAADRDAKRAAEEAKRARAATADYITGLERELASIGLTSNAIRRLAADREIEAALKRGDADSAVRIHQLILETEAVEELAAALEYMAKARKTAIDAANNTGPLKTIPRDVEFSKPDKLEELLKVMEDVQRRAEATRWAVDDIFWSVRSNDWLGAFSGLLRVLDQVKKAFADGANSADKFNAVASVVSAVGGQIGGKAGGALSGAASGAMVGMQLGGWVGAGIGAVVGGIGGWLSGDKAEKAARNAEAMKRAEEELAAARKIAAERRSLEIELMEAQGNAAGALATKRKDELAAMNASNRALQEAVWAAQDLAAERQKLVDVAQRNVDDARGRLSDAYRREADALQSYIDRFRGWSDSLTKFLKGLYTGPPAMLSPEEQYRAAKADFDKVSGLAAGGDEAAIRDLETVSQAYLDASKAYYATSAEYFSDLEKVRTAVTATQEYAASQVNVGEQQLAALNSSVSGILQVNQSVLSVRDALAAYQEAVLVLAAAQAATQAANDNAARGPDWGSYIANNSDVAAEYLRNMGSEKGRKYLAGLGIGSIEQFGQWHWNTSGKSEGRTPYAAGGIIDRPMTLGESGIGGEAGKESIMPLANVGGKMGVHAVSPDNAEVVDRLEAIIRQQGKMIDELRADKVQRAAIDEEDGKRFARIEDELERLTRTKAAA